MRKYTVIVTEDEENNITHFNRENQGFNALELLGILDVLRDDIRKQMTDAVFAGKAIEHKGQVLKIDTVDKCNRKFASDCKIAFPEKIPVTYNFNPDEIKGRRWTQL